MPKCVLFKPLFILGGLCWEHVLCCNNALIHSHMQSYWKAAQSKHSLLLLAPVQLHWSVWCLAPEHNSWTKVCNKYFKQLRYLGPVEWQSISVMYAAMWGQCQSASEKRKRVRVLCTADAKPKKQLEYLLWAAWFSVLAFWMGRLKHFPGISWWSHCRQIHIGKQTYAHDLIEMSCSLFPPLSSTVWDPKEDSHLLIVSNRN